MWNRDHGEVIAFDNCTSFEMIKWVGTLHISCWSQENTARCSKFGLSVFGEIKYPTSHNGVSFLCWNYTQHLSKKSSILVESKK